MAWFGTRIPPGVDGVQPAQAAHWLGRELDALVFETGRDLPADALAIAAGLLRGGGVFLLLVGSPAPTPFAHRLQRFLQEDIVEWPDADVALPAPRPIRRGGRLRLNAGQARVFREVVELPARDEGSSVVITAPRGRGKSTLLGALVGHWQTLGDFDLRVTAPNPAAIQPLLAGWVSPSGPQRRRGRGISDVYVAPAQLLADRARPDLLVVDEAAALPVHRLLALAQVAPRVVFATTTAGFEGSGRGFRLRFLEALRQRGHRLREFRLERPVRWPANDPLEDWINRLFLLDAEAEPAVSGRQPAGRMRWVSGDRLERDERRLAAVVGLLSDAHYRTRPSDLQRWLDGPGWHVGLLEPVGGGPLLGVVLARSEPGLDPVLARAVWRGERRPPGHFLPCVLAGHGSLDAARRPALRVARIAVHPQWQRRGLGTRMLRAVQHFARRQGFAMVGASFGARPDLLRFWNAAGFRTLRIGFQRETTSGLHAAVVLRGLDARARDELRLLRGQVAVDWPIWRGGPLRALESGTASAVQQDLPAPQWHGALADAESILGFADAGRPFELALPALFRWLEADAGVLDRLPVRDAHLLAAALRDLRDWPELSILAGESGRAGVIRALRRAVRVVLQSGLSSASQRA
ncbi:MAG: tRNA(Met) cytidine acetyltransferase [Thioalkalivibrio sp.]|nr:MAG: tRNA(Met) cytidine acetyltransferase [Thioalkalivibrio sp.]